MSTRPATRGPIGPRETAWRSSLGLLVAFAEREGHTRVPQAHTEDGHKLGWWVTTQRAKHRRGSLRPDRAALLEAVPGWEWNPRSNKQSWDARYSLLIAFVNRKGHARVPPRFVEQGFGLGKWVSTQRNLHRLGSLARDRAMLLELLPGWSWGAPAGERWERWFGLLAEYVEREGHARVPYSHVGPEGEGLGIWVNTQRKRRRAGTITADQALRLEDLPGWAWDVENIGVPRRKAERHQENWERWFSLLARYVESEGHARVPRSYITAEGERLGTWVRRQHARLAELDPQHRSRLEALPGWVDATADPRWRARFAQLAAFSAKHGHVRVDRSLAGLDSWVSYQRREWRAGRLPEERARALEALPGWRWPQGTAVTSRSDDAWAAKYRQLQRFARREGHSRVPSTHIEDGTRLGIWCAAQRRAQAGGALPADRRRRLEALPGWEWSPREEAHRSSWDTAFALLEQFARREGHARPRRDVVESGFAIGQWVSTQRTNQRKGRLGPSQQRRLERLPGWVWSARPTGSPRSAEWDASYEALRAFTRREGHARVSQYHIEGGLSLGRWVDTQRQNYRKGALSGDRQRRLDAMPGWMWETPRGRRRAARSRASQALH